MIKHLNKITVSICYTLKNKQEKMQVNIINVIFQNTSFSTLISLPTRTLHNEVNEILTNINKLNAPRNKQVVLKLKISQKIQPIITTLPNNIFPKCFSIKLFFFQIYRFIR